MTSCGGSTLDDAPVTVVLVFFVAMSILYAFGPDGLATIHKPFSQTIFPRSFTRVRQRMCQRWYHTSRS